MSSSIGECSTTTTIASAAESVTQPTQERSAAQHIDVQKDVEGYHPLGTHARHVQDERRRRLKEAMAAAVRERKLAAQCPFAPAITSGDTTAPADADAVRESGGVFDRLAHEAAEREARLARMAAQKQQAEALASDATFRPRINAQPPRYCEERLACLRRVPVEERLLQYGKSVALSVQLQQTLRAMAESTQERTEKIDPAERTAAERAFAERNARLVQQRLLKRIAAEQEAAKELTFRPTLAAGSVALARARAETSASGTAVRDRTTQLYESGVQALQKQKQQQASSDAAAHHPHTNPRSEDWIVHSGHRRLFARDFVARQELYQRIKEEHLELIKAEQDMNASYGGNTNSSLTSAMPPRVSAEMIEEQVHRLYPDPHATKCPGASSCTTGSSTTHQSAADAQCSFKPTLSPGTRYVLRKMPQRERDVVRRLTAAQTNTVSGGGQRETSAKDKTMSSDAPSSRRSNASSTADASPRAAVVEDEEALYRRQTAAARRRELWLRQQRSEQEVQEMLACTFRPRINHHNPTSSRGGTLSARAEKTHAVARNAAAQDDVVTGVAGVTAFLQRQAAARRMQAEAERRRRELGKGKPVNGPGYTLFTPFHLRTESMHERWADLPPPAQSTRSEDEESDALCHSSAAAMTSRSPPRRELHNDGESAVPREWYSQTGVKSAGTSAFARLTASSPRGWWKEI